MKSTIVEILDSINNRIESLEEQMSKSENHIKKILLEGSSHCDYKIQTIRHEE
jgi:uncharacterized protein (UPF0335 family)